MSGKVKIITAAVIIGCGVGGYFYWKQSHKSDLTFREMKVEKGNIAISILATGTVAPENRLEIKPPVAGRIEQVLVNEGDKVRKGQIMAWMSSTERAALLDAARSQGPGEYKKWEELYKPTPVLAPLAGTVILRNVESGQTFTTTDSILSMSDRLTVKAQVDETDIAQIKLQQQAKIVLDAYASTEIPAKVDQIAFDAKTVNNVTTYVVDVLPDQTPEFMRSGMTANVTFTTQSKQDVLLVTNDALRVQNQKTSVMVRGSDGHPQRRDVETGLTDGKKTEITSGLTEGETVLAVQFDSKDFKGNANGGNPFAPSRRPSRGGGGGGH